MFSSIKEFEFEYLLFSLFRKFTKYVAYSLASVLGGEKFENSVARFELKFSMFNALKSRNLTFTGW